MAIEVSSFKELSAIIVEKVNLRDYIERDGVSFKNTNQGGVGLCPFHNEKTGSFNVFNETQSYYCFGCHKSGNIISYVMEKEGLDYRNSVMSLAERNGIQLKLSEAEEKERLKIRQAYRLTQVLGKFFDDEFNKLPEYHPAKKMITDRGLNYETVRYGYAPEDTEYTLSYLKSYIQKKEFTVDLMKELGYLGIDEVNKRVYFPIKNRLMFYFQSNSDKIEGFTGRALTEYDTKNRKYVNSFNSIIYQKSREMYNFSQARKYIQKENSVYLVEGQFDVAAMIENGYNNTIAISGTALDKQHIDRLRMLFKDYTSSKFILCLDDDEAGKKAAKLVFEKNQDIHRNLYICIIPNGKDPCDYMGKDKTIKLPKPILYLDYVFNLFKEVHLKSGSNDPYNLIKHFGNFLSKITDTLLRESYIERLSTFTLIDKNTIYKIIGGIDPNLLKEKQVLKMADADNEKGNYFDKALALFVNNRKHIKNIQTNSYPEEYRKIINIMKDLNVVNIDNFDISNSIIKKLKNNISNPFMTSLNEDSEDIQTHYDTMIKAGLKSIRMFEEEKINLMFKQKLEEAKTPEEVAKALEILNNKR